MARGLIRKPSFAKVIGAYRSQWKRFWLRLFTFGAYGSRGMGWLCDPEKAAYNWLYNRTSISVYKLFDGKASFGSCFFALLCAAIFSIFTFPVDVASAGAKAHKLRKEIKKHAASSQEARSESTTNVTKSSAISNTRTSSTGSSSVSSDTESAQNDRSKSTQKKATAAKRTPHSSSTKATDATHHKTKSDTATEKQKEKKIVSCPAEQATADTPYTYTQILELPKIEIKPVAEKAPEGADESAPRSTPKHENDQYIRKRLIIAGSSYCDASVLSKLQIGAYFELEAEPDSPYDKDAVKLLLEGKKIGYIAKAESLAFLTCLKLNRNIYGVITDIITENGSTKYEYETWFDNAPRT